MTARLARTSPAPTTSATSSSSALTRALTTSDATITPFVTDMALVIQDVAGQALYWQLNTTPGVTITDRSANTNAGTFNQSDLPVHFGLGSATQIDELRIEWPDGTSQVIQGLSADQYLTINTPGDFDGDHDVDGDDLAQWEGDYGINGDSDANLDGNSDGFDFLVWQQQFGNGVATLAATQAVPEPTSALLMIAAAGICLQRCRCN
ncbi:MAG: ASPIC/UnbV domain-containing protein [Planctomycetes bacterium]|nr:ASPIC/UnbV domain-containing protein [Planctomycetota bacterium]